MSRLRLLTLDDFENIYINHILDAFDYAELKRRHAEKRSYADKLASAIAEMGGATTEAQQEALSRALAGRGSSHD